MATRGTFIVDGRTYLIWEDRTTKMAVIECKATATKMTLRADDLRGLAEGIQTYLQKTGR